VELIVFIQVLLSGHYFCASVFETLNDIAMQVNDFQSDDANSVPDDDDDIHYSYLHNEISRIKKQVRF
jgi:hypothetical protein